MCSALSWPSAQRHVPVSVPRGLTQLSAGSLAEELSSDPAHRRQLLNVKQPLLGGGDSETLSLKSAQCLSPGHSGTSASRFSREQAVCAENKGAVTSSGSWKIPQVITVCAFMDTVISDNLSTRSAGSEVAPALETNTTFMHFLFFHIYMCLLLTHSVYLLI